MKDFFITFKFLLKQSLSLSYIFNKVKNDKKHRNMLLLVLIVLIACIPSYVFFIDSFTKLFKGFQTLGLESLFIVIALIASIFFVLFFGMFQIISYFYFSNDVKILTPMPIKPSYYLISKFFVIYVWELIFSIFIVLPFFVIYAVYENIYIYQWITMILSFFLLPIVPLVIVGILTVLLMNLTNVFKSKDALRMIGYTLLVAFALIFQYTIYKTFLPDDTQGQIDVFQNLAKNSSYFLDQFSKYYPISAFIKYAITGNVIQAIGSFLLLLIVSITFVYLLSLLLQTVFVNSYLKEQNSLSKKKKVKEQNISDKIGDGNISFSIAKIDFITILKVPIYAFNSLSIIVILPIIFIISTTVMGGNGGGFNEIIKLYNKHQNEFWLGVTLFLIVSSSLMPIASTTFSREGKNNWIMRTLPIKPKDHILGRLYTPFFTQIVFNLVMTILIVITLIRKGSSINETIIYGMVAVVISLISSLPLQFISILVDLKRPMLKWDNPHQPVKQNMNVLIVMGLGIAYGTILYVLYRYVFSLFLAPYLLFILLFLIGLILTYLSYNILEKQFNKSLVLMD